MHPYASRAAPPATASQPPTDGHAARFLSSIAADAIAAMPAPASCAHSRARTDPRLRPARAIATFASAQQALAPRPMSTPVNIRGERIPGAAPVC